MSSGGPGDHPLAGITHWNRPSYGEQTDALIQKIARLCSRRELYEWWEKEIGWSGTPAKAAALDVTHRTRSDAFVEVHVGGSQMILCRIRRAGRPVATKATGLLVGTSLLLTMLGSASWSQTGPLGNALPPASKPRRPECQSTPGSDPREMIAICTSEISMLERQRQQMILDRLTPQNKITNLDVVIHAFKEVIGAQRIKLGEDPGPDDPRFYVFHSRSP
jgi:hypothetical protein